MTADTNDDGLVNLADNIESEHFTDMVDMCDLNGDAELTECEIHECIVMVENNWRDEYCPDYGHVFCYWDNSTC